MGSEEQSLLEILTSHGRSPEEARWIVRELMEFYARYTPLHRPYPFDYPPLSNAQTCPAYDSQA